LRRTGDDIVVVSNRNSFCDIEFVGVYKPLIEKGRDRLNRFKLIESQIGGPESRMKLREYSPHSRNFRRRIWYTSENLRPPVHEGLDALLSFDQDEFLGTNLYCPSWYREIAHSENILSMNLLGKQTAQNLLLPRKFIEAQPSFCAADATHLNSFHFHTISRLKELGRLDLLTKGISSVGTSNDKISGKYRFILCSENDIYPGYVTNVLIKAYLAGGIPLYLGDLGKDPHINRNSFINILDFPTLREFISYLQKLDVESYRLIYEQPFLNSLPDIGKIRNFILGD